MITATLPSSRPRRFRPSGPGFRPAGYLKGWWPTPPSLNNPKPKLVWEKKTFFLMGDPLGLGLRACFRYSTPSAPGLRRGGLPWAGSPSTFFWKSLSQGPWICKKGWGVWKILSLWGPKSQKIRCEIPRKKMRGPPFNILNLLRWNLDFKMLFLNVFSAKKKKYGPEKGSEGCQRFRTPRKKEKIWIWKGVWGLPTIRNPSSDLKKKYRRETWLRDTGCQKN